MRLVKALVIAIAIAASFGACKKSSSAPSSSVSGLTVTGTSSFTNKNQTAQMTATAAMSDGSSQDVTSSATWASSSSSVASVSSSGLVTALANGTSNITATHQSKNGTLGVTVAMQAALQITPFFSRLCVPFRAGMDVTITESSGNIGMTITGVTVIMTDINNIQRYNRTFSGAEVAAMMSTGNHLNAGESRVFSITPATYPGNVNTEDSTASVTVTATDDAGNAKSVTQSNISQHDRC